MPSPFARPNFGPSPELSNGKRSRGWSLAGCLMVFALVAVVVLLVAAVAVTLLMLAQTRQIGLP